MSLDARAFTIIPYASEAEHACLEMIRATRAPSRHDRRTSAFWNWKHASNPFGASEGVYAVDSDANTVVGLRIFMKWMLQRVDGTQVAAARAVDTATHPSYRRQGIFKTLTGRALTDLAENRVDLVFNTPNGISLPGYLGMGWSSPHHRSLYFRVLNPVRFAKRTLQQSGQSDGGFSWESCFSTSIRTWDRFSKDFGAQIDALTGTWEATRRRTGFRTPRTLPYLNWRYGGESGIPYGVLASTDVDGLRGFVIMRPNRRYGLNEVLIAEIFLRQPSVSLGCQILREARRQIMADWIVAHAAPGTLERQMFFLAGFHRWPRNTIAFVSRPLHRLTSLPLRAADWDLSLGDLEIF